MKTYGGRTTAGPGRFSPAELYEIARCETWEDFAELLGTTDRSLRRAKAKGWPAWMADEAANALGWHPANVWTDWGWAVLAA